MSEPTIREAGAEAIELLEPLWIAMHEHHMSCAPAAAEAVPFRSPPESWKHRRQRYEKWLSGPDSFLLLAERDGRAVGYAVVNLGGEAAVMDTGPRTAELESLSVLPELRGQGIGSMLIDAARTRLRSVGVQVWGIGVMDGNEAARRLYERHGLRSFMTELIGRV